MSEPLSNFQELQKEQMKKVEYFCRKIGDNNLERAERYLNHANWNEDIAVRIFFQNHPNHNQYQQNNFNQEFQNQHLFQPQLPPPSQTSNRNRPQLPNNEKKQKENYLEFLIGEVLIDNKYKNQLNSEYINYLKERLKCIEINFGFFLRTLKEKPGIIIVVKAEAFNILKEQIKKINENQDIISRCIIFPVLNNSPIGNEFCQQLSIINFPSYFFCKYKDEKYIYIIDRMEGAFDQNFVFNSISKNLPQLKQNINSLNSKSNMNVNNKKIKNENNKKDFIKSLRKENYFDAHNNKRGDPSFHKKGNNNNKDNKDFNNKKNIANNLNEIKENNYNNIIKKNNTNINKNNNIIIKNSNTNINKNNNAININNNAKKINKNLNNNFVNNFIEEQKIKENINQNIPKNNNYIGYEGQNMGDFFLGDSVELVNLFGGDKNNSNNKINSDFINQNQNNSSNTSSAQKKEDILADSIYQLTDAQVLEKREKEMRMLEKQQEEKEKKEEEEKRKQIEEEKRIEKIKKDYEDEAEFAKMILSQEPDESNPNICKIIFRSPDGEKQIERRFLKTDKIASLYNYVKSIGREIFTEPDSKDFDILCIGFPPKNLNDKKNNTLDQEGLFPNSILQIREK